MGWLKQLLGLERRPVVGDEPGPDHGDEPLEGPSPPVEFEEDED